MHGTSPEQPLWDGISAGDPQSFQLLFDRYWEPFFQYAYKILRSKEDAEEIVQELFIHLWNKRQELPVVQSPTAYLFTALRHRLLNDLARKKHRITSLDLVCEQESQLYAHEHSERKNTEKLIRSLARSLPEKMQQVYILHQFKGLSIAEIARTTGNSEQTIRNQVNTAVKRISEAYKSTALPLLFLIFFLH